MPFRSMTPSQLSQVREWIARHDWESSVTLSDSGTLSFNPPATGWIDDSQVTDMRTLRIWAGY